MATIYLISDTHFGHANILHFKNKDGNPLRVFDDVHHMDEYMIEMWNSVVRPQDHVYHLGDVCVKGSNLKNSLGRLQGHKRLILGNHDFPQVGQYLPYFQKIQGSHKLFDLLLTHIPVHEKSIGPKIQGNVHGHVHNNVGPDHFGKPYLNVSVEVIDYTPVTLEEVRVRLQKRLGQ